MMKYVINKDKQTVMAFLEGTQMDAVKARIAELVKAEAALKDIQGKYTALEIKHKGTEAEPPHTCSLELLRTQEKAMARYLGILEKRIAIEQIPI